MMRVAGAMENFCKRCVAVALLQPECAPMMKKLLFLLVACTALALRAETAAPTPELVAAALRSDTAAVKKLVAAHADLEVRNAQGWTALMAATHANDIPLAALLISAGADVNARDNLNDTPYLYAGAEGRLEILRLTLAAGADLKSVNRFGGTALIPAAEKGHLANVRELLKTKIDVNHVNRPGWTALLEVCLKKRDPIYTEIVRDLLAAGANPNLPDKRENLTPLQHCLKVGNTEIADLLRAAGGK